MNKRSSKKRNLRKACTTTFLFATLQIVKCDPTSTIHNLPLDIHDDGIGERYLSLGRQGSKETPQVSTGYKGNQRRKMEWRNIPANQKGKPIYSRRDPNFQPIDYGGKHPFELMEQQRRRKRREEETSNKHGRNTLTTNYESYWYDPKFSLDEHIKQSWYDFDYSDSAFDPNDLSASSQTEYGSNDNFNWDLYRPIRIRLDTTNLYDTSAIFRSEGALDAKKNEFIVYHVLPAAIQFWTKALMVFPAKRLFVMYCDLASTIDSGIGRTDADLILYITANRSCAEVGSGYESIAGATSCDWDQFDRPIGGIVDFCYATIKLNEHGVASQDATQKFIETAIHEIGHVLGLTSDDMAYYYDRLIGQPRTPRPVNPSRDTTCVNGKKSSEFQYEIYPPSKDTLHFGALYPGIKYYEVVTPTVKQVAQNHFNCDRMKGMRLENQPTSNDCFGDHWEERLLLDAQMSAVLTSNPIPSYLSPFTLALMEDTGWYLSNYTMSRKSSFGLGAGCDFVEKPCVVNNTVPDYAEGYFCSTLDKNDLSCDPSHRMVATCDLYDLSKLSGQEYPPIPYVFRNFNHPAMGPRKLKQADFCPIYSEQLFSCLSTPPSWLKDKVSSSESFGDNSRCYNSNGARPFCFETVCDDEEDILKVKVGETYFTCDYDGQILYVMMDGEAHEIKCPKKNTMCPNMYCPASCSGRGICNYTHTTENGDVRPKCECFDKLDTTPGCSPFLDLASIESNGHNKKEKKDNSGEDGMYLNQNEGDEKLEPENLNSTKKKPDDNGSNASGRSNRHFLLFLLNITSIILYFSIICN